MANTFSARTGEHITQVALAPVNDSFYADLTLEPPMIRVRAQNDALLYLSSTNRGNRTTQILNYADSVISAPGDGILANKIKRIGLAYLQFNHITPTINTTNNILYMFTPINNRVYTIVLNIGNYITPQTLYTEFVRAANAATGGLIIFDPVFKGRTGLPADVFVPLYENVVTLVSDAPVYFLPQSPFMLRGRSTFNLPVVYGTRWDGTTQTIADSALIAEWTGRCFTRATSGGMACRYSTWVDFHSKAITAWTKNATTSSRAALSTLLYRLYLSQFESYGNDPGVILIANSATSPPVVGTPIIYTTAQHRYDSNVASPTYMTMNPDIPINVVDIELLDEYGGYFQSNQLNYFSTGGSATIVPRGIVDYDGGIRYEIALSTQI